jgi:argininosuccinate lyase
MSTNQLDKKSEAWSALFSEPMSELVKRYTASVFFDKRLWLADITGSLAHAEMLAAQHIIGASDLADIQRGMAQIRSEIEAGTFEWKLDLEDVHLNIEARLTQLVGDAGKRLHTGRSRNDQVATDVRLWLRGEIDLIADLLKELQVALVDVAEQNVDVILPGFTHLQVAQPVSFAHHLLAYVEMFAATPSAWPTCAAAPTACRWAAPRWPAPPTRWTASAWPHAGHGGRRAWRRCARTAWTA